MSASPTSASQSRLIEMSEMKGDDERIPKFLKAASQRDLNNMRELLASGVKASGADYDKRTALHLAASEGHIEAVRLLVENGANLNAIDRFGHTPLDDAISHHHDKVADFLRSFSAEVGDKRQYENALIQAAFQNNTEEAARLLQNGVNVNSVDYDRRTALHLAVAERHENMVKLLLQYNADPQAEDRWGNTPASEAIRHAKRMGDDPILAAFASVVEHMHTDAPLFNKFVVFLFSWEIAMIILIGLFVRYGPAAAGGVDPSSFLEAMYNSYPLYQDVHVMIFVGFGFLMTFLRKNAYMSLALTFLIGAFSIQWFVLNEGFWAGVFAGSFHMVEVDVKLLTRADFAAGAVLISYGVVLGKVSPLQVMVMTMFEVIVYSLNEQIGLKLGVADLGGSMVIHLFGAVFGLTATKLLTKPGAMGRPDASAGYHADIFSMIGTVFLWMYWPSFNGALGLGNTQHRAVINTVLSLSAACTVAFVMSNFMRREGRFNMVDIQNATLAGGVAMGTCADMIIYPGGAVAIGCIAGVVSVAGFAFIQPYFERKFGIHDTCGVLNLHFMPSVLGAMAGFIASYRANVDDYGADQLSYIFAERGGADPRGSSSQALFQFIYFVITIGIALVSGFLAGVILRLPFFEAPDADDTFHDDIYFEVPPVETPYYFDKRGEVIRGPGSGAYELDNLTAGSDARAVDMFIKRLEARIVLLESNAAKAVKSEQAAGRVEEVFERLLAKLDKPHTN